MRHGEHLLLAAGEIGAAVGAPILEPRKHLVDAAERPALRGGQAGNDEIFLDIEAAEDAALLVYKLHAGLRDRVALVPCEIDAVEPHRACARRHHAHQALQRRALSRAVAAEQGHDLVAFDAQRHVGECGNRSVIGVERIDLEQVHGSSTPCTPPR